MHFLLRCLCFPAMIVGASAKISVTPQSDSYVMNSAATTNYGSSTTFIVNSNNGVRAAYLRFDLSSIPLPAKRIVLDLFSSGVGFDSFNVYGLISGESWQESTLKWSNAPGLKNSYTTTSSTLSQIVEPTALYLNGTPLAGFSAPGASNARNRAIDATSGPLHDFIAQDTDKIVTFLIVEQDPMDGSGLIWHSRETTTPEFRPKLTVYHAEDTWDSLRVVLLGGQSNADGRAAGSTAPAEFQPPQDNVPFYYYTNGSSGNANSSLGQLTTLRPGATEKPVGGFGPELSLGRDLSRQIETSPGQRLAIIKYANGGTNLHTDWKAGGSSSTTGDGTVYQTFQRVMRNGISELSEAFPDARLDLAAIIWMQGNSDITSGAAPSAAYEVNQRDFISDIRATFRPNLPFFLAKISDQSSAHNDSSSPNYNNYLVVRAAQEAVAADTPGVYLLNCDGPSYPIQSDGLHFTAAGLVKIGADYAALLADKIILRASILSGPMVRWNAVPGRGYQVEISDNLSAWSRVNVGVASQWTDPQPPAKRFYRIGETD